MGQEQVKSILLIWAELNCAKLFLLDMIYAYVCFIEHKINLYMYTNMYI